jgi:hypothetical protein
MGVLKDLIYWDAHKFEFRGNVSFINRIVSI